MIDKNNLERLAAEWDAVPDMCADFDMFCESMNPLQNPGKYARLVFNLPMHEGNSVPAKTWVQVDSVEAGAAMFRTTKGVDRVTLDFLIFGQPPAGVVIYGTGEKIL